MHVASYSLNTQMHYSSDLKLVWKWKQTRSNETSNKQGWWSMRMNKLWLMFKMLVVPYLLGQLNWRLQQIGGSLKWWASKTPKIFIHVTSSICSSSWCELTWSSIYPRIELQIYYSLIIFALHLFVHPHKEEIG